MVNEKDVLKTLFMSNVMKAKHRNESLRRDIDALIQTIDYDINKKSENEKQFNKLEVFVFKSLRNNFYFSFLLFKEKLLGYGTLGLS